MKQKILEEAIQLFKKKKLGEKIEIKTKGKSMQPLIHDNSVIEAEITKPEKLKTGDIAIYFEKNKLFIHRIIKKKSNNFLTKGDNNWNFDLVNEKLVLGKVTKINGKKTDSIRFKLTKIPILAFSCSTGKIFDILR